MPLQVSLGLSQARNCVMSHDKVSIDTVFGNHSLFYLFRLYLLHRQSESPALGHTLIIIYLLYISESHQIPRTILWDT